jgi:hypothetical protein
MRKVGGAEAEIATSILAVSAVGLLADVRALREWKRGSLRCDAVAKRTGIALAM